MKRHRYTVCGCGKRRYATQEAAEHDMHRIAAMSDAATVPVRVYQCHLSWWHLTSQEQPKWRQAV